MAGRWDCFQGLPHGWEVRFDGRIGRYYFIDHLNKKTSWEDPRLKSAPPPPPHPESGHSEVKGHQESQSVSHHPVLTRMNATLCCTSKLLGDV
ncbi:WW domain-containing protein A [Portunus trituberculatus]|uniref:WW domain-containing protein A n=1 Tax=Portunus trituberculatus TaxID=210409 RepID=A0A5B7CEU8_PORTR|nr:WW domain-containing protein A [Portunus trituberculatus]